MKQTAYRRWILLAAGTIVLLFSGLIYGWSLFSGYFIELYTTWSLSQMTLTFTISMICFVTGGLVSGALVRQLSSTWILRIAGIMAFIGFFGISEMDVANPTVSLRMLYLFYGVIASFGVGLNFNVVLATVGKWFPDRMGLSSGAMMMGFGCGALVLGSLASVLIDRFGLLESFLILGTLVAVVGILSSFIIRAPEEEEMSVLQPFDSSASCSDERTIAIAAKKNVSSREMLRRSSFWMFMIWAVTVNVAGMMVIGSAANIAVYAGAPAIIGMVVSICNGLGRIGIGALFDLVGRIRTMGINLVLLLAAGFCLTFGAVCSSTLLIILGLVVMGFEYGGNPTICSAFAREEFGERYYSTNFALINTSVVPAAIIGPTLSSRLVESAGGSFQSSFIVIITCGVLGVLFFVMLNRITHKGF